MGAAVDSVSRPEGRDGSRGASLVETIAVLALGALLLGAAAPAVARLLDTVELRGATVRFAAALARGRVAALTEGRTWRVRVAGTRSFALEPVGVDGAAVVEPLPGATFFAGATSGGDVRFFPSGLVDNATFTLGAGDARRRVIVNQRGRVTVE